MRSRIVYCLAILLFWNVFLAPQTIWAETGIDKITLNSLSEKDQNIIEMGEIGPGRYVLGGVVGSYLGLGIGHAIQGRYSFSRGWIFTVGELTLIVIMSSSAYPCIHGCSGSSGPGLVMNIGIASYISFRIWEAVDLWVAPLIHNRKYRQIKKKLSHDSGENISLFIYPNGKDYIAMGLQIQF